MLTPVDVARLLATHGLAPHKTLGQNFVVDPNTVRKVVRDAGVERGDLVVEVGPGLGSLTLALVEAGAQVIAVEVDSGLVRALGEVVRGREGVTVLHADALAVDYGALLHGRPAAMVANLPYNVATPIVITALEAGVFTSLFVMVQKEVAKRWAARVGDPLYSAVSVKVAALADAEVVAAVSRHAFRPIPNVDSATVRLVAHPWRSGAPRDVLFPLIEAGFGQRRKRLRNALATPARSPAVVERALAAADLAAGARAEELDVAAWDRLATVIAADAPTL